MRKYARFLAIALAFAAGALTVALIPAAQSQSAPAGVKPGEFPALGKTLWVIETRPTGDGSLQEKFMRQHLAHQTELENTGVMFGAGPAREVSGKDGFGLIIVRAKDEAEAKKIADSDPMHINGARTYKLYKWSLNEGTISVRINFASGKYTFD